jgi:hypothetical protein
LSRIFIHFIFVQRLNSFQEPFSDFSKNKRILDNFKAIPIACAGSSAIITHIIININCKQLHLVNIVVFAMMQNQPCQIKGENT